MREWEARIPLRNPSENALVVLNLVMFLIRKTPRYQEQRHAHRAALRSRSPISSRMTCQACRCRARTVAARAAQVATRRGTTLELPRPRVQRVRMLPRRRKSKYPQWFGTAVICVLAVSMITGTRVDFFLRTRGCVLRRSSRWCPPPGQCGGWLGRSFQTPMKRSSSHHRSTRPGRLDSYTFPRLCRLVDHSGAHHP